MTFLRDWWRVTAVSFWMRSVASTLPLRTKTFTHCAQRPSLGRASASQRLQTARPQRSQRPLGASLLLPK